MDRWLGNSSMDSMQHLHKAGISPCSSDAQLMCHDTWWRAMHNWWATLPGGWQRATDGPRYLMTNSDLERLHAIEIYIIGICVCFEPHTYTVHMLSLQPNPSHILFCLHPRFSSAAYVWTQDWVDVWLIFIKGISDNWLLSGLTT